MENSAASEGGDSTRMLVWAHYSRAYGLQVVESRRGRKVQRLKSATKGEGGSDIFDGDASRDEPCLLDEAGGRKPDLIVFGHSRKNVNRVAVGVIESQTGGSLYCRQLI